MNKIIQIEIAIRRLNSISKEMAIRSSLASSGNSPCRLVNPFHRVAD